jgi:hypothetical protein
MRLRPYLTLLRHNGAFSRLLAAQLISFAGDWFATVAVLGLALEVTGSPAVASLFLVVQTGAFAQASPIAGALAERFSPAIATWSMVGLAAVAASGWIAFSRPVWRRR